MRYSLAGLGTHLLSQNETVQRHYDSNIMIRLLYLEIEKLLEKLFILTRICFPILSKIADVGNPKTPTPLASANIGNEDTPPPIRHADVLNGWSLTSNLAQFW